ncbi:type I glutamate--ammonia ligase [Gimesia maris]|jgi:glutamine synthetase|uniref:Glutamine synthetase n=1 Tax=Gimesia maris TaxID=122 RepID=A0A3D3RBR3_9PLAN|nr:type I glutamate--ammonia ligase [Gimesia maris]MAC53289.1 type I glutamate--ammonia ligase [Gimesia sp.]EDL58179.1 glutamine synthetase, type I [Gimesia maris DSM 8797]QDU16118.1 Glutamine synthetase [Gimesia maris]QEG18146.1 Glutamine synthetase [Gimesia maris]QGQ28846.1 type I glutamate--ammonia ligase [Gimesia maris]|tara:strand:+ start:57818 stop:59230 length:1413 start_codon:yes stop_codon:yes gene_type:complete
MTPKDFFAFAEKNGAKMVDLKFTDIFGTWQHCSYPISTWDEGTFEDGVGFDGSSIRGWQTIDSSDMLAVPDPASVKLDPFFKSPTVSVLADIVDPITKEDYNKDPRNVAKKGLAYLQQTGIADSCFIGPEPEFFIFDDVRYLSNQRGAMYEIDSSEAAWNTGRSEEGNLGHKVGYKGGYFPVAPTDTYGDLRAEMVDELQKVGIVVEAHHHEVATAGQCEIDMEFSPLLQMADQFMWYKYIIKNVAKRNGKTVTFMPKPVFDDNGSGMHTHISLWKDGNTLMAGDGYAGLSELALHAIGGILKHGRALIALSNPTANSFHRLVPGFEAPVTLAMSQRNRSASCRIPMYSGSPKAKRVEFRCPDPTANGYLSFTALMMAMIDGVQNKIDPGEPLDRDIYDMTPEELAETNVAPKSLDEALVALEEDSAFLTAGDVFSEDLIKAFIKFKRTEELDPIRLRPHPYEFDLYYNA